MGLVITTVGGPGKFGYKKSFDSTHPINAIIESALTENGVDFITYPFDIYGSDERQYSSQGFRINVASITKDKYYEYHYYHTSLDNLEFVTSQQIEETLSLHERLIDKFESRRIYRNTILHGEVRLSSRNLYPTIGGAQLPGSGDFSELDLTLWLLFLCDGCLSLDEIALRVGVSYERLALVVESMCMKGVLQRV